ncbi:hypothetical protein TW95_gp0260 [Pandoravirus inopinatum]|uniref:Uncharacterized protein n=1 Tax=Pandoravirus inopinatum TaxID=1605721 RepID=A0A0B5J0J5_9VIRU|nr:hypothetical protein TW95_gp0260 [Pandoravirus inopinatum]AJF96994.1 hypothetical protein [Pandoravirus inopinatum]
MIAASEPVSMPFGRRDDIMLISPTMRTHIDQLVLSVQRARDEGVPLDDAFRDSVCRRLGLTDDQLTALLQVALVEQRKQIEKARRTQRRLEAELCAKRAGSRRGPLSGVWDFCLSWCG